MPRQIEQAACRVPLEGGAIFKYSYMSAWKADYTVNGKRLRPTLSPDKREALRMANELLEEKKRIEQGSQRKPMADVTLKEVVDTYLEMRRAKLPVKLRETPRKNKSYRIDEDRLILILSRLPAEKVAKVNKSMCREFISSRMREKSQTNPKKTVGVTTAGKPVKLLISALCHGASVDLCGNPLLGLEVPVAKGGEIRKSRRAMTAEEYGRFLPASVARDAKIHATVPDRIPQTPAYMALYEAGRRREEVVLLEWPSLRLDGDSPTWDFWDTKGDKLAKAAVASNQPETCAIPPRLAQYLRALKRLHERMLGRAVGPGDRVFLSPLGCRLNGDNLRIDFYAILESAKIPRVDHRNRSLDLHAGRMTLYARGAAAGIPVDEMMSFIGHRDIRTAMRHYRDPNCANTQKVAARLAKETEGNRKGDGQNGNDADSGAK
jgi:hypothetical protein